MSGPAYTISFSATLYPASSVSRGQVLVPHEDGGGYVAATTANRTGRRSHGVALTSWVDEAQGAVEVQHTGILSADVAGIGAGASSWVRTSTAGYVERFTPTYGGDSDVLGWATETGAVHLLTGVLTESACVNGAGPRELNVLDFGATAYDTQAEAEAGADSSAAFQSALDAAGPAPSEPFSYRGGVVIVPPGYYRLASVVHVRRNIQLRGYGGSGRYASSVLVQDRGVWFQFDGASDNDDGADAAGTVVQHILFHGANSGPATVDAGVTVHCPVHFAHCTFLGFQGHGLRINGDIDEGYNANCGSAQFCWFENCTGSGLYVNGGNGNQWTLTGCMAISNDGVGFDDHSFLGNVYVGCLTDLCLAGSFTLEGAASRGQLIGCYAELNCGPVLADQNCSIMGGNLYGVGVQTAGAGTPMELHNALKASYFAVTNRTYEYLQTFVGGPDGRRAVFGMYANPQQPGGDTHGDLDAFYLGWNDDTAANEYWSLGYANGISPEAFQVTAGKNKGGPALLRVPQGVHLGRNASTTDFRRLAYASAQPSSGLHQKGDMTFDSEATAGRLGWRCTATGGWGSTWTASAYYAPGSSVVPTVANGKVYRCVSKSGSGTAYTSATTQPSWPTTIGATVTDGGVTWECFGVTPATFEVVTT